MNILKKRERLAQVNFLQEPKLLYFKHIICEFLVLNFIVFFLQISGMSRNINFTKVLDVKKHQLYESLLITRTCYVEFNVSSLFAKWIKLKVSWSEVGCVIFIENPTCKRYSLLMTVVFSLSPLIKSIL